METTSPIFSRYILSRTILRQCTHYWFADWCYYCFVSDVGIDSNQCYRYYLFSFFYKIVSFAVLELSALVLMLPANISYISYVTKELICSLRLAANADSKRLRYINNCITQWSNLLTSHASILADLQWSHPTVMQLTHYSLATGNVSSNIPGAQRRGGGISVYIPPKSVYIKIMWLCST